MKALTLVFVTTALAACSQQVSPATHDAAIVDQQDVAPIDAEPCRFPSGRPCSVGSLCLHNDDLSGSSNSGCSLTFCAAAPDGFTSIGVGCQSSPDGSTSPVLDTDASVECDPDLAFGHPGMLLGRQTWCAGWREMIVPNGCVRIENCNPIACDPQYSDACPWDFVCSPTTRVCIAP